MLDPARPKPAGQVALVTGATRGLGRVLAVALARAGMDIALVGRGSGSAAAAEIEQSIELLRRRL